MVVTGASRYSASSSMLSSGSRLGLIDDSTTQQFATAHPDPDLP